MKKIIGLLLGLGLASMARGQAIADYAQLLSNFAVQLNGGTAVSGGGGAVISDTIWDAAGDLAVGTGADTAARLAKGSNGDVLTMTAGAVGWTAPASGTTLANDALWAAAGDVAYATADNAGAVLTAGSATQVLHSGATPSWSAIVSADITDLTVANADIANSTINLTTKVTNVLPEANGGTGQSAPTDDNSLVGNGSSWEKKALPSCADTGGNHLNYSTGSNTFSCGTTGDGTGAPSISTTMYIKEDFFQPRSSATSTCGTQLGLAVTNTGGTSPGNNTAFAGTGNHPGICQFDTGTASGAGASSLNTGATVNLFALAETLEWETCVSATDDGTDTYTLRQGFIDTNDGTAPTDGCWFEYTGATNSGKWQGICKNNAGPTTTNTTVAPTVCPTFQKMKIVVNADATSVAFSTDGTASAGGAVAANIPTAAGREFGMGFSITKLAGTGSRKFQLDYIEWTKTVSR